MKIVLLNTFILFCLTACSSDPLDQKYTEAIGLGPLLEVMPPISKTELGWIMMAKKANDEKGVSNEGRTFRELSKQGNDIAAAAKAQSFVDSINYKAQADQRQKK
ncbi:hypothetical protein [Spirosoma pollinicola]|uniref:Uncharacterized protein n=1 Tax=Spirosoma pollinicola TaxID=2057025 RepID=A0A2K8ZAD8_9BACT|nr:hypothetical protein [Spirosoma pollinicola]AUD06815.1 hypothetical protein CWM47_36190 [Spirosoma pollinicola]RZK64399.1 MAG: hypothetical protein EOO85_29800 [Pedobacter sp.]